MITKEQLVCTREQAIMLKSLGVNQRSLFEWTQVPDKINGGMINILDDRMGGGDAALTATEIMEELRKRNLYKGKWSRMLLYARTNWDPVKLADILISQLR